MRPITLVLAVLALGCDAPRSVRPQPPPRASASASAVLVPEPARADIPPPPGHTGAVESVAFSPDGQQIASGSEDRTVKLWDAASGALVATFAGHRGRVNAVRFTADGRIASGSEDGTVRLWDRQSKRELASFAAGAAVHVLATTRDGHLLSGGADKRVRVWDLASGHELAGFGSFAATVRDIAVSHDGAHALVCSYAHRDLVQLFDLASGQREKTLGPDADVSNDIAGVAFSADDRRAVVGHWAGATRVWDIASGKPADKVVTGALNHQPLLLGDDRFFTKNQGAVELWDFHGGKPLARFRGHEHNVLALALSPDERRVASGSIDRSVRVWDVASGAELAHMGGGVGFYYRAAYAPDGWRVARGGGRYDADARAWRETAIHVVSLKDGAELGALAGDPPLGGVTALAFSPDGTRLLSAHASSEPVRLWDVAAGAVLSQFDAGPRIVGLAFLPDGARAVTLSELEGARLVDLASGRTIVRYGGTPRSYALALSRDGRVLATGHAGTFVALWDVASGALVAESPRHAEDDPRRLPPDTGSIAISPDGALVAVGDESRREAEIRLLNAATGATVATWPAHREAVTALAFLDGGRLASSGQDARIVVWDVASGRELAAEPQSAAAIALLPLPHVVLIARDDASLGSWRPGAR